MGKSVLTELFERGMLCPKGKKVELRILRSIEVLGLKPI